MNTAKTTTAAIDNVPHPRLEDYSEKYRQYLIMERHEGILEVRFHSQGGVLNSSGCAHVWAQAWSEIGNDPDNEVIIITATGDQWIRFPRHDEGKDGEAAAEKANRARSAAYAYQVYGGLLKNTENLVIGLNVPTIGVIQGPAFVHYETALLCDLTLCARHAFFKDPHADFGIAPGDGLGLAFQHLMSPKQQAYYLYTGNALDAETALRLGLVNEVLATERLLPRARELARQILRMPKLARLMCKQIVRRELQQRHARDAGFHVAHELVGLIANVGEGTAYTAAQARASVERFDREANRGVE